MSKKGVDVAQKIEQQQKTIKKTTEKGIDFQLKLYGHMSRSL